MNGYRTSREYGDALDRIAGLLLSLAVLAECTCARSHAVRSFVLWILRPAESLARAFVMQGIGPVGVYALPESSNGAHGGDCAEAMRLAYGFRVLAMAIRTMMRRLAVQCRAETQDRPGAGALFLVPWMATRVANAATGHPAGRARDRPGSPSGNGPDRRGNDCTA